MSKLCTVTTSDNPYHPLDDFDNWLRFDNEHCYYTLSFMSELTYDSEELPQSLRDEEYNRVVDEIVKCNIIGWLTGGAVNYIKAVEGEPLSKSNNINTE